MNRNNVGSALIKLGKSIPHAYATVMFSDNLWVGLAMLLLTLVSPIVGLAGLLGLLTGLLSSRILGFEGWDSSSGVMSFNSLLIGLAVGYYYPYAADQSVRHRHATDLCCGQLPDPNLVQDALYEPGLFAERHLSLVLSGAQRQLHRRWL
jgi:hypothetical protein